MNKTVDPNSFFTLGLLSILNSCGAAALLLAPVIVGGLVTTIGFSGQQAGYIISSELAGLALAAIPSALWLSRFNWQKVLYLGLILLLLGNTLTAFLATFEYFLMVRFMMGFVAGICLAVSMSVINLTREPDRNIGFWFSLQLLITVVGLALLPGFIEKNTVSAVFLLLAGCQFFLLFLVHMVPTNGGVKKAIEKVNYRAVMSLAVLGFTSIFLFEVAIMGVWTYYERIGNAAGLSAQQIANALAVGTFVGFLGSASTAILSTKLGRLIPIAIGLGLAIVSIFVLRSPASIIVFVFSASAFCFAWYFTLPYLMASIAGIDPSGRLLIFVNFITGAGLTAGPAVAAKLQSSGGYEALIWMGIIALVLSFLLIIKLALLPIQSKA